MHNATNELIHVLSHDPTFPDALLSLPEMREKWPDWQRNNCLFRAVLLSVEKHGSDTLQTGDVVTPDENSTILAFGSIGSQEQQAFRWRKLCECIIRVIMGEVLKDNVEDAIEEVGEMTGQEYLFALSYWLQASITVIDRTRDSTYEVYARREDGRDDWRQTNRSISLIYEPNHWKSIPR